MANGHVLPRQIDQTTISNMTLGSAMQDVSPEQLVLVSGGVPEPSCTDVRVRDGYVIVCK